MRNKFKKEIEMNKNNKLFAVRMTSELGDTWDGYYCSTKEEARRYAHFILNQGFDNAMRANVKSVRVVEK